MAAWSAEREVRRALDRHALSAAELAKSVRRLSKDEATAVLNRLILGGAVVGHGVDERGRARYRLAHRLGASYDEPEGGAA